MDDTVYDGYDELYHHAKLGEDRTTCAGCRCENVVFFCFLPAGCREAANCRYFFTHRQKSGFSPRRGDSLHRFGSNFVGPTGTWVRLAVQNFTSIGAEGWECGPLNIKNFHFLVKSRPVGATPLTDFENFQGFLYVQLSYVSVSNFM